MSKLEKMVIDAVGFEGSTTPRLIHDKYGGSSLSAVTACVNRLVNAGKLEIVGYADKAASDTQIQIPDCDTCNGNGLIDCDRCDWNSRNEDPEADDCDYCHNTGRRECPYCDEGKKC